MGLIVLIACVFGLAGLWLFVRADRDDAPLAVGACPGLAMGLMAAGLYAMRREETDRAADFVAMTVPICLLTISLARSLLSGAVEATLVRSLLAAMGAGVLLALIVMAGRLSLLDAQLLLAAGAVLVLIADSGRTEDAMRSVRPILAVMGALLIGALLWWMLWMESAVGSVWTACLALPAVAVFGWGRGAEMAGIRMGVSTVLTSVGVALTGGALGALGLTIAQNLSDVRPAGITPMLEVLALSVGTAPPLIGMERLVPEAVLLIAGPAVVLSSPRDGLRKAIAWILALGAVFLLGDRFLGVIGVDGRGMVF